MIGHVPEIAGHHPETVGHVRPKYPAIAVSLSAMTIGAILSTALLIGPAAIALRLAKRPGAAIVLAATIGLAATSFGIFLSYESFYWTPGYGWPVSFFIVALIYIAYLLSGFVRPLRKPRLWAAKDLPVHALNTPPNGGN